MTIKADNQLLIDALVEATELSKKTLKSALDKGCIWLKTDKQISRIRRIKKLLNKGDEVFIYWNEEILSSVPTQPTLILDKKSYSIWFKPAGVFSQGSKWGDHCSITRLVEKILDRPSFLVHRLDRATSGLMIVAHSKAMARDFSKLFADRLIKKTYLAIVSGSFPVDKISLNDDIDDKHALSHITKLAENQKKTLLSVHIETGRKHQIRKHLSDFNFPIIGDRLYSDTKKDHLEDLQLQAVNLVFNCPIDQQSININLSEKEQLKL